MFYALNRPKKFCPYRSERDLESNAINKWGTETTPNHWYIMFSTECHSPIKLISYRCGLLRVEIEEKQRKQYLLPELDIWRKKKRLLISHRMAQGFSVVVITEAKHLNKWATLVFIIHDIHYLFLVHRRKIKIIITRINS